MPPDTVAAYEQIGMELENAIRNKILSNVPPPNAESTRRQKQSSTTLIDTGTMLDSIKHIVEYSNGLVTITAGIVDEGEIAEYASYNEYGTGHIPERSFIRSTFDEIFDQQIMPQFADDMQKMAFDKLQKR